MAVDVALPYRTDWREMSGVLDYCKGKGADRGALEARFGAGESLRETLNALEQLGLVVRGEIGDVRLTTLGEQLAYAPDAPRQRARLVEALLAYAPYRFPLERAVADAMDVLDAPWVEHIWQVDMRLGQPRNRVEEARTLFFRLADEAGLGAYRRGVRGQTTRLELTADVGERLRPLIERQSSAPANRSSAAPIERGSATRDRSDAPAPTALPLELQQPAPRAATVAVSTDHARATPAVDFRAASSSAGANVGLTVHVDMSEWDLDKIEAFLRLLGLLAE
jgi:hypothetical protein